MNKPIGVGLIVAGVLLAIYGVRASDAFASDVSRFFTGSPTDKSVWLLLGGVACIAVGATLIVRRGPQTA